MNQATPQAIPSGTDVAALRQLIMGFRFEPGRSTSPPSSSLPTAWTDVRERRPTWPPTLAPSLARSIA